MDEARSASPSARAHQNMSDRDAITDLVARFDDATNRRDAAEMRALWADDGVWEIMEPRPMRVDGGDRIVATWLSMLGALDWFFRGSFAGVVSVEGDRATGRWPCVETGRFGPASDRPGQGYDNRSIYEDVYVRRDDGWVFARRRYLYLWLSEGDLPGAGVPLGPELEG